MDLPGILGKMLDSPLLDYCFNCVLVLSKPSLTGSLCFLGLIMLAAFVLWLWDKLQNVSFVRRMPPSFSKA